MKLQLNFLKKHAISLTVLSFFSVLIWFRGSEILWQNIAILATASQRGCLILAIWLLWLLKMILIEKQPPQHKSINASPPQDIQKKLARLQGRFEGAIEFLKKTMIRRQNNSINLLTLPWLLVIGPKSAGKSALLSNSTIHYILSKQSKLAQHKTMSQPDMCDWWVTRDLVLVDVPGAYLTSYTKNSPPNHIMYHLLWKHLLHLVKTTRGDEGLQGVVMSVNLPELIQFDRHQKTQVVQDLKKRISEIHEAFGTALPIHLVITKCDLLPGFSEFFGECTSDELSQLWGITLPAIGPHESLIQVFNHRFNALIKQLNKQLLAKLHHERHPASRPYIKDFPLHVERLKDSIAQFIKALGLPTLSLQGVYLTSSRQEENSTHTELLASHQHKHGHGHVTTETEHTSLMLCAPSLPSRSYFTRQLIAQQLPATTALSHRNKTDPSSVQRKIAYASAASIATIASLWLALDFKQGVQQTYAIQRDLAHYQETLAAANETKAPPLSHAIPLLDALKEASDQASRRYSFTYYSEKSRETALSLYQQALQTIVIPQVKDYIETYLAHAKKHEPDDVYRVLKAYLMLGNKKHFDSSYISAVLGELIPNHTNHEENAALSNHIQAALNAKAIAITLNDSLIQEVRDLFFSLPNSTLGMVILKYTNHWTEPSIDMHQALGSSTVFNYPAALSTIPLMYTAKGFARITAGETHRAAAEALYGNWVLGFRSEPQDTLAIDDLSAQLETQYIASYIGVWETFVANIELNVPTNLAQTQHTLATLTGESSPLLMLLKTIRENTALPPILNASHILRNLNLQGTEHNNNNTLYGVFASLKEFQHYLQTILNAPDANKALLEATAQYMQHPDQNPLSQLHIMAESSPEPIKTWMIHLAATTWHNMVKQTAQYIEASWQQQIALPYQALIGNRYPFNQAAKDDVDLLMLTEYFSQAGKLSQFYQTYFKPFVIEEGKQREWRIVQNEKMPFSTNLFETYAQLSKIQRTFFPNGDNKLYIPFTLHPITIDRATKNFTLTINGQELPFQKNTPRVLTWPGNHPTNNNGMHFETPNHQLASETVEGSWGWFRLVSQATEKVRSQKEMVLHFTKDGHSAKYLLFTQGQLNPFLPDNLTQFTLPEHLG